MTSRILPVAEYDRLADTYLAPLRDHFPAQTSVIVVEDGDRIVATWALMLVPHVEGVWTHPDYRHNPAVIRHLLTGMRREARAWGVSRVMTGAMDDTVRGLLAHLGAEPLPGDHYVWPLGDQES
jgi:hypothetical protein